MGQERRETREARERQDRQQGEEGQEGENTKRESCLAIWPIPPVAALLRALAFPPFLPVPRYDAAATGGPGGAGGGDAAAALWRRLRGNSMPSVLIL